MLIISIFYARLKLDSIDKQIWKSTQKGLVDYVTTSTPESIRVSVCFCIN